MKHKFTLLILTLGHFCVDLACLYFYFAHFPHSGAITIISSALLYNFFAFALQAPIGYFFDRFPARRSTTIGLLFIIGGYLLGVCHLPSAGLLFCGIGNAFYHVGGSIDIARTDKRGLIHSGIFVSSGALGVSLGTFLGEQLKLFNGAILLLLIVLLFLQRAVITHEKQKSSGLSAKTNAALLLLSLFAVFIRSFGGLFFPPLYKEVFSFTQIFFLENPALYLFLTAMSSGIVAFLGKFSGGFLSCLCAKLIHRLFPKKKIDLRSCNYIFGIVTLLLSILFFTLGSKPTRAPEFCFLGVMFFHAAMPVTLYELYCILPDRPGFAMGLSTVMLFLGYLPYALFPLDDLPAPLLLPLLTLLAAICMTISLLVYCRAIRTNQNQTP